MTIPPNINNLINQLNQELEQIEQDAAEGMEIAQRLLSQFPDNLALTGYFGMLGNYLFFIESSRQQISSIKQEIAQENVTAELLRENAEYLANLLGRTIEVKIEANNIKTRFEGLL